MDKSPTQQHRSPDIDTNLKPRRPAIYHTVEKQARLENQYENLLIMLLMKDATVILVLGAHCGDTMAPHDPTGPRRPYLLDASHNSSNHGLQKSRRKWYPGTHAYNALPLSLLKALPQT